jgi:hypothetical protein
MTVIGAGPYPWYRALLTGDGRATWTPASSTRSRSSTPRGFTSLPVEGAGERP